MSRLLFRSVAVLFLSVMVAVPFTRSVAADDLGPKKTARPARPKLAVHTGKGEDDLKALRETFAKLADIKVKADEIQFSDIKRDDGLFTKWFQAEIDLAKTDLGAVAKAVASTKTSKKTPPVLYLIVRYRPGSANTKKLQAALEKVKGVAVDKSWAGDANIWIGVDGTGQGQLAEITRALHGAGIPITDPILDTAD